MQYEENGRVMRGVGGLYEVRLDEGDTPLSGRTVPVRAKGNFRHKGLSPLVGDRVRVAYDDTAFAGQGDTLTLTTDGGGSVITAISSRHNALIRPPMANLDVLFVTFAAADPAPVPETVDKLISIAEFHHIAPVILISKSDLDPEGAKEWQRLYRAAGFPAFAFSAKTGEGVPELQAFVSTETPHKLCAFSGASGVGKSTLLNTLFAGLQLETGEISRKIARGKHTTRCVELYPVAGDIDTLVADTPGFSMLDFVRFDFFTARDLPFTVREFVPLLGECRYKKCTHTKEEGCAILSAVREGRIAPSRHDSYCAMYAALKDKHEWSKK